LKNIFITEGDPTGISYEIFDRAFAVIKKKSNKYNFIFVSSQNKINPKYIKDVEIIQNISDFKNPFTRKTNLYHFKTNILTKAEENKIILGKPSVYSGKCAFNSLLSAINMQKQYGGDIITLPLSKEWVIASGIKNFKGHTEVFAEKYNSKTFMLMYGKSLKVIPLTTHIPLNSVSKALAKIKIVPLVKAIQKSYLLKSPRIGFCGLNPHAGENGKIGTEEKTIILPFIKEMKEQGLNVEGPISADSLFIPEISKNYGLIFACYHDQGLIPFKSLEGKNGINVTLGLDFLRVSPDHGTAFDIAGKNIADPESFIQCIKVLTK